MKAPSVRLTHMGRVVGTPASRIAKITTPAARIAKRDAMLKHMTSMEEDARDEMNQQSFNPVKRKKKKNVSLF